MSETATARKTPPQAQARQPGVESKMHPRPESKSAALQSGRQARRQGRADQRWRFRHRQIRRHSLRQRRRGRRDPLFGRTEDALRTKKLVEGEGHKCALVSRARKSVSARKLFRGPLYRCGDGASAALFTDSRVRSNSSRTRRSCCNSSSPLAAPSSFR